MCIEIDLKAQTRCGKIRVIFDGFGAGRLVDVRMTVRLI